MSWLRRREPYRHHPYRDVPYLLNSQEGPLADAPLAFAHRGADPDRENTLAAFRRAVELGYRYLEIDVRTSADGELVIFHDEALDRVTNGTGKLSEKTWEHLAQLRVTGRGTPGQVKASSAGELKERVRAGRTQHDDDVGPGAGYPLLRFEDALTELPDTHFNVDLKDAESVRIFAEIVQRHRAQDRVLAASFNDLRRHLVRRLFSTHIATSGGWVAIALIVLLGPLGLVDRLSSRVADIDCVQVPIRRGRLRIVTRQFIQRCHKAGLQVHVWVVDDPDEIHHLLDLGVDGIVTDDAEALAAVMRQRAVWPQT